MPESLVKHRQICKKTSKKERKVFDSGRQRAEGSDVAYAKTKETKKVQVLGEKPDVILISLVLELNSSSMFNNV